MDLAKIIGSMAVVLGVVLVAGHAFGEEDKDVQPKDVQAKDNIQPSPATQKLTVQQKLEEREAQRRAEMAEQQRRKEEFSRRCSSSALKSEREVEFCRVAYRKF
jgi:hypothetical protein